MKRFLVLAAAALSFAVGLPDATAQEWPAVSSAPSVEKTGTNDVALLIGIEDYLILPDVPGARQNVNDWETFLRDGLGVRDVFTLRDSQAVREEILSMAEKARDAAGKDSTVWVLFVGHGAPKKDGSDGMLVGADGQQTPSSLMSRSVAQKELIGILEKGKQQRTVLMVDSCFSGRDNSGEALAEGVQPVVAVSSLPQQAGLVVMMAAQNDEFAGALPGASRPAFSYLVLGALRGWADNGDGAVTAREAVTYAQRELSRVPGRQQTPQLIGDGSFRLASGAQEEAPRVGSGGSGPATDPAGPAGEEPVTVVHWNGSGKSTQRPAGGNRDVLYFKGAVGGLALNGIEQFGPMGSAELGIKAFNAGSIEFRIPIGVHLWSEPNPGALGKGDCATSTVGQCEGADLFFTGDTGLENIEGARITRLTLGAGPGVAYRSAGANRSGFSRTVYVSSLVGINPAIGGRCTDWSISFTRAECIEKESSSGLIFGGRVGIDVPLFDISAMFLAPQDGLVFGLLAGFSFDR